MWKPGRPVPHPRLVAVVAQDQCPPPRGVGSCPAGGGGQVCWERPNQPGPLAWAAPLSCHLPAAPRATPWLAPAAPPPPKAQAQLTNGHGNWGALPLLPDGSLWAGGAGRSL